MFCLINNKEKACSRVGIKSLLFHLTENSSNKDVSSLIDNLNNDQSVDGILLQLPLPRQLDSIELISKINPEKDVAGLHEQIIGRLV